MKITDYSRLVEAIAGELMRNDLAETIPIWIGMAESQINRELRALDMVKKCRTLAESREITLPTDWLEGRRIQTEDGHRLLVASLDELSDMRHRHDERGLAADPGYAPVYSLPPEGTTGCNRPRYYAVEGTWLELFPNPTPEAPITLEMTYYARLPAISDQEGETSNWLLRKDPSVYFYGALLHSAPYLLDDSRLTMWARLYQGGVDTLNAQAQVAEISGSPVNRRRNDNFWG